MEFTRAAELLLTEQVYQHLQKRLLGGEWGLGARLPSEHELGEQYHIARGTLRQVLGRLESAGLIRRERGRGTFAAFQPAAGLRSLAFIVPYVRDSFIPSILVGVESAAREHGLSVVFTHVENRLERQEEALRVAAEQNVSGIILYPVNSRDAGPVLRGLVERKMPLVLVDRSVVGLPAPAVTCDNFGGAVGAVQHLLGLGHRRIAFLTWQEYAVTLEHRRAGYLQALREAQIEPDPALDWSIASYPRIDAERLTSLLRREPRPTAVFASNDQLALEVLQTARRLGLRLPEDLSLVGFDNQEIGAHLDVPLTSVAQPAQDVGRRAVELAAALITGAEPGSLAGAAGGPTRVVLPTWLVVRKSTAAPRGLLNFTN